MSRSSRWEGARGLIGWALVLVSTVALPQSVYNYFPPPGITYTPTGGMSLGSATGGGQGVGTLNAQEIYVNGVAVGTGAGSVTSVSVVSANGLYGAVATPTTTPAITLSPTFTGIAYSNGTGLASAVAANFPTLNQNTTGNAATATLASTASALASSPTLCAVGQAAQGILANGDATGCVTPFTVVNENANTAFMGPVSGGAGLPSFRTLVAADLPLSSSLTFTGDNTMGPASGVALTINGAASSDALDINNSASQFTKIVGSSTTSASNGLDVIAGTNSSDMALLVTNRAGSSTLFSINGAGTISAAGSLSASGNVSATNVSATGTVSGSTVTSSGTVNAVNVSATGTVSAAAVSASGSITSGGTAVCLANGTNCPVGNAPAGQISTSGSACSVVSGSRDLSSCTRNQAGEYTVAISVGVVSCTASLEEGTLSAPYTVSTNIAPGGSSLVLWAYEGATPTDGASINIVCD